MVFQQLEPLVAQATAPFPDAHALIGEWGRIKLLDPKTRDAASRRFGVALLERRASWLAERERRQRELDSLHRVLVKGLQRARKPRQLDTLEEEAYLRVVAWAEAVHARTSGLMNGPNALPKPVKPIFHAAQPAGPGRHPQAPAQLLGHLRYAVPLLGSAGALFGTGDAGAWPRVIGVALSLGGGLVMAALWPSAPTLDPKVVEQYLERELHRLGESCGQAGAIAESIWKSEAVFLKIRAIV